MFGPLGVPEMLFILALALLVFGPRRLPELGRTIGKAMGEFRRATTDLRRTLNNELALEDETTRRPAPAAPPRPRPRPVAATRTEPARDSAPGSAEPETSTPEAPAAEAAAPEPAGDRPVDREPAGRAAATEPSIPEPPPEPIEPR